MDNAELPRFSALHFACSTLALGMCVCMYSKYISDSTHDFQIHTTVTLNTIHAKLNSLLAFPNQFPFLDLHIGKCTAIYPGAQARKGAGHPSSLLTLALCLFPNPTGPYPTYFPPFFAIALVKSAHLSLPSSCSRFWLGPPPSVLPFCSVFMAARVLSLKHLPSLL